MKAFVLTFAFALCAHGFLYSETVGGEKIKWNPQTLNFYVNPTPPRSGLDDSDIRSALEESVSRWNSVSPVKLKTVYTSSPPNFGMGASLRFSSNPGYFGSGVLAVTSVSYNNSNGSIYSADIIMNDSGFSAATLTAEEFHSGGSFSYVGDIITHEIGHLLGLNHSEVIGSSMIFNVFKNQHEIQSDDKIGIESLYETHNSSAISGRVVGLKQVPVFGAHVQAIDLENNQVAAGVFTGEDGTFSIEGLSPGKSYALYMTPIRHKDSLPEYYKNFKAEFCDGKDFAPSFFSRCGGRSVGTAQVIQATTSNVDIGDFTVKCATSVDPQYLSKKLDGGGAHNILDYYENFKTQTTFTGYFTRDEIENGKVDRLTVDLSGLERPSGKWLVVRVATEALGTGLRLIPTVRGGGASVIGSASYDPWTGKPKLDSEISVPMNPDADFNIFEIELKPSDLSGSELNQVFGDPNALTNEKAIYFVNAEVMESEPGAMVPLTAWSDYPYEDNQQCLEGDVNRTTAAYTSVSSVTDFAEQSQPMSCATVADIGSGGGGPGGGMMSFALGLSMACAAFALRSGRRVFFV